VSGTLLTDEQRRRQEVARMLFPRPSTDANDEKARDVRPQYVEEPTLVVWARPLETGFSFPGELRKVGSALVQVPLQLRRPETGTKVVIPTTFLPVERVNGPAAYQSGSAYSTRLGRWEEIGGGEAHTWLRFQLPQVVLPIRVDGADLDIEVRAPARKFQVEAFVNDQLVILKEQQSPVGTVRVNINSQNVLNLDDRGGLLLGVAVSAPNALRSLAQQTARLQTPRWTQSGELTDSIFLFVGKHSHPRRHGGDATGPTATATHEHVQTSAMSEAGEGPPPWNSNRWRTSWAPMPRCWSHNR
jgi:hypothetical protein